MATIERYGKLYTSGDVKLRMLNRTVEGLDAISYGRKQAKENVYAIGSREPVGRIRKQKTYECSVTVKAFEFDAIKKTAPLGDITSIKPFMATVVFLDDEQQAIKTDTIEYMEFTGETTEVKNDNGELLHVLEVVIGGITTVVS